MPYKKLIIGAFAFVILLIAGAITVSLFEVERDERTAAEYKADAKNDNVTGENVQFIVTEGDLKKWTVKAEKAKYYPNNTGALLDGISGQFFNKQGKPVMAFAAPHGEYSKEDNKIVLTGGVVAQTVMNAAQQPGDVAEKMAAADTGNQDAVKLKAPKMSWSSRSDEVLAEGGVVVTHSLFGHSSAEKCRFSLNLSNIALEGRVASEIML